MHEDMTVENNFGVTQLVSEMPTQHDINVS